MKFSLNTIRKFNRQFQCSDDILSIGLDALVDKIGSQLGAIEEIINFGEIYQNIFIVKVVSVIDHPNADRLHLCKIDDGGKYRSIERDKDGYIQVVCGAPNVHDGMFAAWLPPGSTVPETYRHDPLVLSTREIRGQKSNGMLASPKELGLGDNHEGILDIDGSHDVGEDFATTFDIKDDVVIDIENKMFTHRPDLFGFLGIARELAGIQNIKFMSPSWYSPVPIFPAVDNDTLSIEFQNELTELVPRFTAVSISNVAIGPSPVWLQVELAKNGMRSINNIVDFTNYFMIETGQPLHAYDYDKVKAHSSGEHASIVVRNPKPGEKLRLLNGKTIEPRADAIMIATNKELIGVGGVMGGSETEVDNSTKNIIIECANFDMYSVRKTGMEHGLFTDALTRFNKGQSPLQNGLVLARIVDEIKRTTGGKVAGPILDNNHLDQTVSNRQSIHPAVRVSVDFINSRLGLKLTAEEMERILVNVEFKIDIDRTDLIVLAPFWRTDIELREDIVEEIGRLYGYDKLPLILPKRAIKPASRDELLDLKQKVRTILARAGANELLTYSFVHQDLLDKVGQKKEAAFQVSNALSPSLQYYRLSLTPSLLEKIHPNIKTGYDKLALYEIGKTHETSSLDDDGLPIEYNNLSLVFASNLKIVGAPYFVAQKFLQYLMSSLGVKITLKQISSPNFATDVPFATERSAVITETQSEHGFGVIGEIKPEIRKSLKLPDATAAFELNLGDMLQFIKSKTGYTPLSKYPSIAQDVCLRVDTKLDYQSLYQFIEDAVESHKPEHTAFSIKPIDIFQRDDDDAKKQLTFRLTIVSFERTLNDKEVNALLDQTAESAKEKFGAERI